MGGQRQKQTERDRERERERKRERERRDCDRMLEGDSGEEGDKEGLFI